mgnify:CR=1 FL=1
MESPSSAAVTVSAAGDAVIKIFSDKFPSLANCLRREFNFLQKAVDEVLKRMDRDSSGRVQR